MSLQWVSSSAGAAVPHNAIHGGSDSDGTTIYIGRCSHEGDQLPVKVMPGKRVAYIAFNGNEVAKENYEVLCGSGFSWVQGSNGKVPSNAVPGGRTSNHEVLYIGRAHYQGSVTPGKIHTSHGCLYFPFGGVEQKITNYEVLIHNPRSEWIRLDARSVFPAGAILGGHDSDGSKMYVGRAVFNNDQMPAKVIPSKQAAYVAFGGGEHLVTEYEVLCNGSTRWENSHGRIPSSAVLGGKTSSGEKLYIGRGHHNGSLTVGKVHPSHGTLYIPFGGAEVALKTYEILLEQ